LASTKNETLALRYRKLWLFPPLQYWNHLPLHDKAIGGSNIDKYKSELCGLVFTNVFLSSR